MKKGMLQNKICLLSAPVTHVSVTAVKLAVDAYRRWGSQTVYCLHNVRNVVQAKAKQFTAYTIVRNVVQAKGKLKDNAPLLMDSIQHAFQREAIQ